MKATISTNINRAVIGELLRIVLFVLYYLFHIILGIGFFVGAFFVSKFSFWALMTSDVIYGRAVVLGIIINIAVWILASMVGFYLIKPLFKFYKE